MSEQRKVEAGRRGCHCLTQIDGINTFAELLDEVFKYAMHLRFA
ncbi:hypothetical protein [Mesorhizobium cantuariense]|uniref:Uncharacterized protein n=1 Tax=Mesorhizobium cantuariense TaxID=1300275 RepID=A0ABV7MFF7_9HYPH